MTALAPEMGLPRVRDGRVDHPSLLSGNHIQTDQIRLCADRGHFHIDHGAETKPHVEPLLSLPERAVGHARLEDECTPILARNRVFRDHDRHANVAGLARHELLFRRREDEPGTGRFFGRIGSRERHVPVDRLIPILRSEHETHRSGVRRAILAIGHLEHVGVVLARRDGDMESSRHECDFPSWR